MVNKILVLIFGYFLLAGCSKYYICLSDSCSNGQAKIKTKNCDLYEGEVKDGQPFGMGTMKYSGDSCAKKGYTRALGALDYYKGMWGKNEKGYSIWKGKGEMFHKNGFGFVGEFDNDEPARNTEIVVHLPDKKQYKGVWRENSACVGNCENGKGFSVNKFGWITEGEYKNGSLNGKCQMQNYYEQKDGICENGSMLSGTIKCAPHPNVANYCEESEVLRRHFLLLKIKKLNPSKEAFKVVQVDKLN